MDTQNLHRVSGPEPKPNMALPCICDPDQESYSYRVGCERHTELETRRGPSASPTVESHTVTYYHGEAKISTPVLHDDGAVWSRQDHVRCDHNHTTLEAAADCAQRLANKAVKS